MPKKPWKKPVDDFTPNPPKGPEEETIMKAEPKKRKISFKHKIALMEVLARKRRTERINYEEISQRTQVPKMALRQLASLYDKGLVDLGIPQTPEEKLIDGRMQHEKMLDLLREYKGLIVKGFEGVLLASKSDMMEGKPMGWQKRGLPLILSELKSIAAMQAFHEKGYVSILDDEHASRKASEKRLTGTNLEVQTEARIIHASDEQRGMAALGLFNESDTTAAHTDQSEQALSREIEASIRKQDGSGDRADAVSVKTVEAGDGA